MITVEILYVCCIFFLKINKFFSAYLLFFILEKFLVTLTLEWGFIVFKLVGQKQKIVSSAATLLLGYFFISLAVLSLHTWSTKTLFYTPYTRNRRLILNFDADHIRFIYYPPNCCNKWFYGAPSPKRQIYRVVIGFKSNSTLSKVLYSSQLVFSIALECTLISREKLSLEKIALPP